MSRTSLMTSLSCRICWVALLFCLSAGVPEAMAEPIRLLFLGDLGHHQPAARAEQLIPVLASHGIQVEYTTDRSRLTPTALEAYRGLIIYANIMTISPEEEAALLSYVERGGGLIALHCASFCFLNSPKYFALVGGQFKSHETGTFSTEIAEPEHPIMRGFAGFESWDETYVHHLHNPQGRTVLEYRVQGKQAAGQTREPWTWVRDQGKGRVFYTAWGHDQRTWSHPGFQQLVERGIRWACHEDPSVVGPYIDSRKFTPGPMTEKRTDVAPFSYVDVGAKIPNYTPSARWGTQGEPISTMQEPLAPEESIKHFVTPRELSVKLFASEKNLLGKPIAMNWDERGRLWVLVTSDYPNDITDRGVGNDKLQILEDTDRDGLADTFTLFADKLNLPTAIVCAFGGAIVQNGTETLFLKDTNGDGRADVRNVLLTGWGLGDTHGGVSNFRYGPDNWIWAMQGYNPSVPQSQGKEFARFQMGFFRFKVEGAEAPRVTAVEFLRSTYGNTWGLGLSEEGLVFGSSANGHPSLFLTIPNRYYERVRGWTPSLLAASIADSPRFVPITDKVRQVDHHGNYSAAAGHAVYTARAYPPTWWNKTAFVCGPEGHLVGTFVLKPNGANFQSSSPINLLASDDEWSAPILAEVGPDGFVWVIDWYNYIVQHNPTPIGFENGKGNAYVTDLRDKNRGRIYRVIANEPTAGFTHAPPTLEPAEPRTLLAALRHPTLFCRLEAQRLLVERGEMDVVPDLQAVAQDPAVDTIGLNVGVMHALWTLAGLRAIDLKDSATAEIIQQALAHRSAGVRRAAITSAPPSEELVQAFVEKNVLDDLDPQVRLAAILAIADVPASLRAADALATCLSKQNTLADPVLRDALICAAAAHAPFFLSRLTQWSGGTALPTERQQEMASIITIVSEHASRSKMEAAPILDHLDRLPPFLVEGVVSGWAKGWPATSKLSLSAEAERHLSDVFASLSPAGRASVVRLSRFADSVRLKGVAEQLLTEAKTRAQAADASTDDRLAAVRLILELAPERDESASSILALIDPSADPEWVANLLKSLGASTSPRLADLVLDRMASWTPRARSEAIRLLLSRTETTRDLVKAIDKGTIDLSELSADQKQSLANHPDQSIALRSKKVLQAGGGLADPDRAKVLEQLLPLAQERGDVARGQIAFKAHCAKCHKHGEMGENIGPNLTGMAVHPKAEILLNIIDPSRSVETNYRAYTLTTVDGRVLTGLLAAESKTTVEMVDAEGKRSSVPREDIDEILASKKSFMPEGLEKQMKPQEIVDVLEFMTARGKFTPLDLRPVATIVSTKGMFNSESADVERLIFDDWSPKTVEGVPYLLIDPQTDRIRNVVMLKGELGEFPPRMPTSVSLAVGQPVKRFHFLSGVGGWSFPATSKDTVSMIVRIHYEGGATEEHSLLNGVHFADYIRRVDVPGSKLAFMLRGQQIRTFAIEPRESKAIERIELVKGPDPTAPVVMAITAEAPEPTVENK